MNFDNKFGKSCNCPGIVPGGQLFTNYISSRLYNASIQKNLNINNSHDYRYLLQQYSEDPSINNNKIPLCESNKDNKFYIDFKKHE